MSDWTMERAPPGHALTEAQAARNHAIAQKRLDEHYGYVHPDDTRGPVTKEQMQTYLFQTANTGRLNPSGAAMSASDHVGGLPINMYTGEQIGGQMYQYDHVRPAPNVAHSNQNPVYTAQERQEATSLMPNTLPFLSQDTLQRQGMSNLAEQDSAAALLFELAQLAMCPQAGQAR
jgi:hypothetical protein